MSLDSMLDGKVIMMMVTASLTGYIFYGHITLAAKVETVITVQEQSTSELDDLWSKYNDGQQMFVGHMMKEMDYKVKQAEKWEGLYKEKYQELKDSN
jgi:hypothetical protein